MAFPALPSKPGKSALETRLATYVILLSFVNVFNNFSQKKGGWGGWVPFCVALPYPQLYKKSREKNRQRTTRAR